VERGAGEARLEVLVVSPACGSTATQWYVDADAARAHATQRLRACVACLEAEGVRVKGRLSGPDPVHAIGEALRDFPADEILLVTARRRPSAWLRGSTIEYVRRSFPRPVEHVVLERAREDVGGS
jgi:nucleotide-binding universal stress UspA family protein